MRVLILGTYPIDNPVHGGQRRAHQIAAAYTNAGIETRYLCITAAHDIGQRTVTDRSFCAPVDAIRWFKPAPYTEDVFAGLLAEHDEACANWLAAQVQDFSPTHIQFEQPYLYPALKMLRLRGFDDLKVIYSSHNWEAPLKTFVIAGAPGGTQLYARRVGRFVAALERSLVKAADVVIAAAHAEGEIYRGLGARKVIICLNGVAPDGPDTVMTRPSGLAGRYMLTVGSGHPPNSAGFCEMLLAPAMFYLPPEPVLAIAGDMAHLVRNDPRFGAYGVPNMRRVAMFAPLSNEALRGLKYCAHGFVLPVRHGAGSNLKTAEAIQSGKWVLATSMALRGFEQYAEEPGIVIEDDPRLFRFALKNILAKGALQLSAVEEARRRRVEWSHALAPLRDWLLKQSQHAARSVA